MVTIETISIVFTGISISLAAFYYINTLRNAQRNQQHQLETRQAQLFMQMYDRWNTLELRTQFDIVMNTDWNDYEGFVEYSQNEESMAGFNVVAVFVEGVGVLVKRGLIEAAFVDDLMSGDMMRYWEKIEPIVYEIRERRNWPQYGEWIEYLYHQIKTIAESQHPELKT